MRQRKKLSWTKRGFVRTLGPKGSEKKFYLGFDPVVAEQKEKAIVAIWQQIEDRALHVSLHRLDDERIFGAKVGRKMSPDLVC